jgi:hypothetical protein
VRAFRAEHDGFSGVFAWADETVDVSTAAALLAAVAALAVYVPVRRATGVDPAASLRCE